MINDKKIATIRRWVAGILVVIISFIFGFVVKVEVLPDWALTVFVPFSGLSLCAIIDLGFGDYHV